METKNIGDIPVTIYQPKAMSAKTSGLLPTVSSPLATNRKIASTTETSHPCQAEALMSLWRQNLLAKGEFQKTVQEITQTTAIALAVERVGVWLFSPERAKICCLDLYETSSKTHSTGGELSTNDYPHYFRALRDHLVIAAHHAKIDPRTCEFSDIYLTPLGIEALLDAPIRIPEGIAGVVCIEHTGRERTWSVDEQVFATSVANIVAMNIQANRQREIEQALRQSEERFLQSQKLEALGRLAGGVAHDFNNLLTVISNYSELLLRRLESGDRAHKYAGEIKNATQRATLLTRQLLTFSRQQVATPVLLNLNAVISEITPMLHRLVGEDIEFTLDLDSTLRSVQADLAQLEQVLMNLVVNARDAMPNGGTLTIRTQNLTLCPAMAQEHPGVQPGSYILLSVRDTGMGMDVATQSRIFDPFFTTKEPGKGTGLGLATVFGIIKQCNGTILVDSQVDQGTLFRIYLPQNNEIVSGISVPATLDTPLASLAGTETILLVEDEEQIRTLTSAALRELGYTVLEAANGIEALRLFQHDSNHRNKLVDLSIPHPVMDHTLHSIDLVITDVIMPGMNGRQLHKHLLAKLPTLKVLYISGYPNDVLSEQGGLTPDSQLLYKPFTSTLLASKVREMLAVRV